METGQNISKEIQQKKGFDEKTKLQAKSLIDEIDRKQQSLYQNTETKGKTKYINLDQIRNARFCYLQVL